MTTNPWEATSGSQLQQGDWLPQCPVPVFATESALASPGDLADVGLAPTDVVVVTQSCDLEVRGAKPPKVRLVAVCPMYSLSRWVEVNPNFQEVKPKEQMRRGEVAGVHLIATPDAPEDNQRVLVASFREIYSLPYEFISSHAARAGRRWRLRSPYLEHFSQAFARFFMRVGLPSDIPPYLPEKR